MENVFHFILFCVLQKCCAQQESSILKDFQNQRLFISRSNSSVIYNETRCSPEKRMISYNDVVNLQKQSLNISGFTAAVWINATGSYTPWVIFKGLYTMKAEHIFNSTGVNDTTQFIDCVRFCSLVNWTYIGLQKDKCYCLSSDALQKENQRLNVRRNQNVKTCGTADMLYCATTTRELIMAVYKKDESHYKGIGECLKAIVENEMYLSYVPSPCKKQEKSSILCIDSKNTVRTIRDINTNQILQVCEVYNNTFIDFKTLNTTMNVRPHSGGYYLNNLRESIFSQEGQTLQAHCVTGKAVGGKIKLHITDYATTNHAMCIDDEALDKSKTHIATKSNTYPKKLYSDVKVTTTNEIRNKDAKTVSAVSDSTATAQTSTTDEFTKEAGTNIEKTYNYCRHLLYVVPSIVCAHVLILVIFFICWAKYYKRTNSTTSVERLQSPYTQTRLSQVQSNPLMNSNNSTVHDYAEVESDIMMTTMPIIAIDEDGYMVPEQLPENVTGDPNTSCVTKVYINNLPMSSAESFNLYQHLEEQRQSDTHQYSSIRIETSNEQL